MNKKTIYFNALLLALCTYQNSTASFLLSWFIKNPEITKTAASLHDDSTTICDNQGILKKSKKNDVRSWIDVSMDGTIINLQTVKRFVVIDSNPNIVHIQPEGKQRSTKESIEKSAAKRSSSLPSRSIADQQNPTTKKHRSGSQLARLH